MKIRTLKLKEAHKCSRSSFCSILWDQQANHLVTASSSDPTISIHGPLHPPGPPKVLRHHRDGVTALALSPNSTCLSSGSIDNSVKLYKFPGGEFETNITRFTLPIRALAFNKSGSMLAAAGDDDGIKLINTIDGSIARVLKAHRGPVTCLAFDPISEYLASVDSFGTVIFWELQTGRIVHTLKGVAPITDSDASILNILSWSPDGETLAVPGLRNDVVMYDRDTAEKLFSLRGDHVEPVCYLAWSPNGKYMATSGLDKQVLIWDLDKKQDIDRQKFDDRICCLAWKPIGNALAVIDAMGKYGIWDSVVPSSMKSPTEDIPSSQTRNSNGLVLFEEEYQELSSSGSLSDHGEDILGESEPPSRKRLRRKFEHAEDLDEDVNDEFDSLPKTEHRKKVRSGKESLDKGYDGPPSRTVTSSRMKMQGSFQPGATPLQTGKRRFLCYNMLGTITSIENDGYSHIETEFHDTGRGSRVPSMTDHFGFKMASLNEYGSVFANSCKGEKNMSTLLYRPFSTWANNSEWSMRFEGEEVKVVALGTAWVAAITSLNILRTFTDGGLQRHILSLDGPVVTASGFKDQLAIVTHASDCLPSNDQVLEFRVLNISNGTQLFRGRLPLTPGSQLSWFGFSEEGQLSSYDSKGVLRVFTSQFGGSWLPVFSANKEKKTNESYWVVGLNASKLFCVVCKSPNLFPEVMPKPVLTLLNLAFPVASSDLGADTLENDFIMNNMHLSQIKKRMDEMASAGLDTAKLDDEAFDVEAAQDRCILKLIASCCNGDKLVRATELVKLLSMEKSVRGAIKLVTALKLPNLAERFNGILEKRLLDESMEAANLPLLNSNNSASASAEVAVGRITCNSNSSMPAATENKNLTVDGKGQTPEAATPVTSTKLTAPFFTRIANKQKEKVNQYQTGNLGSKIMNLKNTETVKEEGNAKAAEMKTGTTDSLKVQPERPPSNPFLKPSNNQENGRMSEEKSHQLPANPFKKSSK